MIKDSFRFLKRLMDSTEHLGHVLREIAVCDQLKREEKLKAGTRTSVINACASHIDARRYLEIGVRNPADNFEKVSVRYKESVDPGLEFPDNPVTYPMTSDAFFEFWERNNLEPYDVIFIDGLHVADQVARDIKNALKASTEKGIVILHDCNPPHQAFAREDYGATSGAKGSWNGTTYKAAWEFAWTGCYEMKIVDADWGIGVIDKSKTREERPNPNPYFEWNQFEALRKSSEVLIKLDDFKAWLKGGNDNM